MHKPNSMTLQTDPLIKTRRSVHPKKEQHHSPSMQSVVIVIDELHRNRVYRAGRISDVQIIEHRGRAAQ